jgi:predicted lipoprotein with Yx(FWY)xxD motif
MKTSRKSRAPALYIAAAALALSAAACGSNSGSSSGSAPVPSANGQAVSAQTTSLGTILVDGKARTVYQFANDRTDTSTCTGSCAANWPFVPAPTPLPSSEPGVTGQLGMTTRDGGDHQLTVAGHPVYTFAGDSAPGQTNGQNQTLDGGLWTVLSAAGTPVTTTARTKAPAGPGY